VAAFWGHFIRIRHSRDNRPEERGMGNSKTSYGSGYFMVDHGGVIGCSMGAFCERFPDVYQEYINDYCPAYYFDNSQYLFLSTGREIKSKNFLAISR